MAKLTSRFAGSSIIEAIVASLIFLLVFVASLSTLTAITLRNDEGYVLLEAERAQINCFHNYGDGLKADGTYTDTFVWGEITTTIAPYHDYEGIQEVAMSVRLNGSTKTIEYRRLVLTYDD